MSMETKDLKLLPSINKAASVVGFTESGELGIANPYNLVDMQGVDLNTITTPGDYAVSSACPNFPISGTTAGLIMRVFIHTPGYIQQLIFAMRITPPYILCRVKNGYNAPWGGWYKLQFASI